MVVAWIEVLQQLEAVAEHALDRRFGPVGAAQVGALHLRQPDDDLTGIEAPLLLNTQPLPIALTAQGGPSPDARAFTTAGWRRTKRPAGAYGRRRRSRCSSDLKACA